jgi:uncharacterized protein
MTKRELVAHNREAILALAARHGARDVRLFGSVARGDDDEASDVDFVIRMSPGRDLFDLVELTDELQELLGCTVDLVTEHSEMRPHFRAELEKEAIAV